jgi:hypothetical protein
MGGLKERAAGDSFIDHSNLFWEKNFIKDWIWSKLIECLIRSFSSSPDMQSEVL